MLDSDSQKVALADGTKVRALLHNIRLYDELAEDAATEREQLEKEMELAIPTIVKAGLFGLFGPDE